jgi:catechol 2,3-dioxygenase-like lactoylglutathione lyase family enzyme
MTKLTQLRPMLAVTDLKRTMDFYCNNLGFRCAGSFGNPEPVWCELVRDDVAIMFNAPPRESVIRDVPPRSKSYQIFYINPEDVVELRWKAAGVPVSDLRVTVYGMKEFELRDPDGYWLWFGQPTDDPPTVKE